MKQLFKILTGGETSEVEKRTRIIAGEGLVYENEDSFKTYSYKLGLFNTWGNLIAPMQSILITSTGSEFTATGENALKTRVTHTEQKPVAVYTRSTSGNQLQVNKQ